jgi:HK97 family phage prohead protease
MEKRVFDRPVTLRKDDEDRGVISGYAAVFYRDGDPSTQYELWPGAVERVMRSAFDKISGDDVRAMFDHQLLLGRRSAGTLKIEVDDVGLRYEIQPSDTTAYRDTAEHVRLGNVTGSSFAFNIRGRDGQTWTEETRDGLTFEVRELLDLAVFDVGPVVNPAYVGTSTGVRGAEVYAEARSARDAWAKSAEAVAAIEADRRRREAYLRKSYLTAHKLTS